MELASEMWIRAGASAERSVLRRMLPITHACSQVKWEKVRARSSWASSVRSRVGVGRDSSIVR